MPNLKYVLQEPTESTLERVKEIQFYLIIKSMQVSYNTSTNQVDVLMEALSSLFGCNWDRLSYAMAMLESISARPSREELVIGSKLLGVPNRTMLDLLGMANSTYYKILQEYINEGEYPLAANLRDEEAREVNVFLDGYKTSFKHATHLSGARI